MVCQEVLDRARSLAVDGDVLIDSAHYAEDCIRPKCNELRGAQENISSTLRIKRSLLLRAMELHAALEKVETRTVPSIPVEMTFAGNSL